jgi:hypothetical protein
MLFMTVYSYDPAHRNEIIKRRLNAGPQLPEGLKLIGEWSYIGSGKVFRLVEAGDNPEKLIEAMQPWSDLGTIETYPVLEVEKAIQSYAKAWKILAHV